MNQLEIFSFVQLRFLKRSSLITNILTLSRLYINAAFVWASAKKWSLLVVIRPVDGGCVHTTACGTNYKGIDENYKLVACIS